MATTSMSYGHWHKITSIIYQHYRNCPSLESTHNINKNIALLATLRCAAVHCLSTFSDVISSISFSFDVISSSSLILRLQQWLNWRIIVVKCVKPVSNKQVARINFGCVEAASLAASYWSTEYIQVCVSVCTLPCVGVSVCKNQSPVDCSSCSRSDPLTIIRIFRVSIHL